MKKDGDISTAKTVTLIDQLSVVTHSEKNRSGEKCDI